MMTATLTNNRGMFWRIVRRLVFAHRGRLFVILLALVAGAAITAALLNLQVDAKRRLTSEFRAFGANVVIAPHGEASSGGGTLNESEFDNVPKAFEGIRPPRAAFLYFTATAVSYSSEYPIQVIVAGGRGENLTELLPGNWGNTSALSRVEPNCFAGTNVVRQLHLERGGRLVLRNQGREESCIVAMTLATGGPEDNQVFVNLDVAQHLANLPGKISLIEISYAGTPEATRRYISRLGQIFPEAEVRPIRQFTEAQAKIYSRISGLLNFTVALVLVLTALCVMAAMANVAMERRNDVGLMKAIGGARRRVLRLFLTEAVLLGLIGGLIGAAAGIALSIYLGKAVFGLAARPRLIVYPVSVALTMIVAILSAYPLRHLANVRPASVFRGEA